MDYRLFENTIFNLFNKSTHFIIGLPNLILTNFPIIQKFHNLLPNFYQQIQILDLLLLFLVIHLTCPPFPSSINFSNNSFHASTILHYRAPYKNPSLDLLLFQKVFNGLLYLMFLFFTKICQRRGCKMGEFLYLSITSSSCR